MKSITLPFAVLTWWLALAGAGVLFGQVPPEAEGRYLRRAWTIENGLPQNYITALAQTRDGYLWLGGNAGLARFDGVSFTLFNTGNTPGLQSNRIHSLDEVLNHRLRKTLGYRTLIKYSISRKFMHR